MHSRHAQPGLAAATTPIHKLRRQLQASIAYLAMRAIRELHASSIQAPERQGARAQSGQFASSKSSSPRLSARRQRSRPSFARELIQTRPTKGLGCQSAKPTRPSPWHKRWQTGCADEDCQKSGCTASRSPTDGVPGPDQNTAAMQAAYLQWRRSTNPNTQPATSHGASFATAR